MAGSVGQPESRLPKPSRSEAGAGDKCRASPGEREWQDPAAASTLGPRQDGFTRRK
jgi:hypothetical protein